MAPPTFVLSNSLVLENSQKFDISQMRRNLQNAAYRSVDTVFEHGEYAVRGAIMDIFPMGSNLPYRIDLFDNEIDSLRTFDPETQRSINHVKEIVLLPAREFPLTDDAIRHFKNEWYRRFESKARECPLYRDVSKAIAPSGVEYYLPLFFEEMATLFDYLPENTRIFSEDIGVDIEAILNSLAGSAAKIR